MSLLRPSGTLLGTLSPFSSSLGIARARFISALAHSSHLIEGELILSISDEFSSGDDIAMVQGTVNDIEFIADGVKG